jgi:hypothetical protein
MSGSPAAARKGDLEAGGGGDLGDAGGGVHVEALQRLAAAMEERIWRRLMEAALEKALAAATLEEVLATATTLEEVLAMTVMAAVEALAVAPMAVEALAAAGRGEEPGELTRERREWVWGRYFRSRFFTGCLYTMDQ